MCEICGRKAPLDLDHCHRCQMCRGELCRSCNVKLDWWAEFCLGGFTEERIAEVEAAGVYVDPWTKLAVAYLNKHDHGKGISYRTMLAWRRQDRRLYG